MPQTLFEEFLDASKFNEAAALLQKELADGKLIDPRSDPHWPTFADVLAKKLGEKRGIDDVVKFWEGLLAFVIHEIQPKWGHAHKGHIYLRLGLTVLQSYSPTVRHSKGKESFRIGLQG